MTNDNGRGGAAAEGRYGVRCPGTALARGRPVAPPTASKRIMHGPEEDGPDTVRMGVSGGTAVAIVPHCHSAKHRSAAKHGSEFRVPHSG